MDLGFEVKTPIHTSLQVLYTVKNGNETDISQDVAADLLSCCYVDKIDDEADTVTIDLKDNDAKWASQWDPERGDSVRVAFITQGRGTVQTEEMMIDNTDIKGRPRTFSISAVNIPLNNTVRRTVKTRYFEGLSLSAIGSKIASDNGLGYSFDSQTDPTYDRTDQKDESDLVYLKRLCKEAGLSIKVYATRLNIYDQTVLEKQPPVAEISEWSDTVKGFDFHAQQSQRYKAVSVKYRDVKKKTLQGGKSTDDVAVERYLHGTAKTEVKKGDTAIKEEYVNYTYTDESVDDSAQVFVLKKRCTSIAEAERIAKAKLRELNLHQITGNITVVGNPMLVAGAVVKLSGFSAADGNFIIEEANHTMNGSGYTTSIQVRKCNTAY